MFDARRHTSNDRAVMPCIKRGCILMALLIMTTQLVGCGASVVGNWRNDNFQPPNPDLKGPGSLMLNIRKDQTFSAVYESKDKTIKRGATGRWDQESESAIRIFIKNGDGPEMTNAELADNNTLQLIGKGFAEKLTRD